LANVQRLAREQGEGFSITGATLHRRLHERGLLVSIDETRGRRLVRRTLEGRRHSVLHLHADALSPQEPAQTAQPAHTPVLERLQPGPIGPIGPPPPWDRDR